MNSHINKIYAFFYRNIIFSVKNFFTFVEILFWPVIGIFSIGLMGNFLNLTEEIKSFLLSGVIISGVLQVVQLDVAYGLLYDIWSKSIKQTFLSPIRHFHYIIGSWMSGIIRGIISFILLILISKIFFNFELPSLQKIIISLTGIFLSGLIIGMIVIFFLILYGQRVDIIAWLLSVIVMLLCGIYYPVKFLPLFLQKIVMFIPLTYFIEIFRFDYGFSYTFSYPVLKGYFLSFFYIIILYCIIIHAYKYTQKTGLIIKLSE